MPAVYQKLGVHFLYPENWQVLEEESENWPNSLTLQSEQTSFWTLNIYPAATELKPVVKEIVDSIKEVYPDLEVIPTQEVIGDALTKGVDICFFYLDLLVEARIRTLRTPSQTLVWHYQAESREFEKNSLVFKAIAQSMLQKLVPVPENQASAEDKA
ncbi:MAG: hypothetical protein U0894_03450 [Pirellulales bacterium]